MGRNTNTVLSADIVIKDKTKLALNNIDQNVGKLGKQFGTVGLLIKASVGKDWIGSITRFGQEMLTRGQEIGGVLDKVNVVFGDSALKVEDWAVRNAGAFGESTLTLQGMAASIGDLLVPIGFARDEAADFALKTLDASVALSSWSDGKVTVQEAADVMTKAFLGERESLVKLGIKLSDADIKARLLSKGQEELEGKSRKAAEAIATQELILEQSKDALDKYGESTDSVGRKAKEMKSQIENAKDELALRLIPVMTDGFDVAGDFGEGLGIVIDWIKKLPKPVAAAVAAFGLSKAGGLNKALSGVAWIMANPLLAALGAVAVAVTIMGSAARDEKAAIDGLRDALEESGGKADVAAKAYLAAKDGNDELAIAAAEAGLTLDDLALAALGNEAAMLKVEGGLRRAKDEGRLSMDQMILLNGAFKDIEEGLPEAKRQIDLLAEAERIAGLASTNFGADLLILGTDVIEGEVIPAVDDLTLSTSELADEQRKAVDPAFALREAYKKQSDALAIVEGLKKDGKRNTDEYKDALVLLLEAQGDLNFSIADFDASSEASIAALEELGRQAGLSEDEIRDLILSIDDLNKATIISGAGGGFGSPGVPNPGGPLIPFQTGGIVPGAQGSPVPALLHGGEIVLNRAQQGALLRGGGGLVVNVSAGTIVTESQLEDVIMRVVTKAGRRNGML